MKSNEGRLQTGEHVLAKILEKKFPDAKVVIAKFEQDQGLLEMSSEQDLRKLDRSTLQEEVHEVLAKNLTVKKYIKDRKDLAGEFDLAKIPSSIREIRIVEIEGFDKRPCRDPHVDKTREVGKFTILRIEKVGKDRYRFTFTVD